MIDAWTDDDGYSYTLTLTPSTPSSTIDVVNAKPGSAVVGVTYSFSGTLTNTTPGHNAPFPLGEYIVPLWDASDPICAMEYNTTGLQAMQLVGPAPQVCTFDSGVLGMPPQLESLDGGSKPDVDIGAEKAVRIFRLYGRLTVPESDARSFAASLAAPEAWAIARDTTSTTTCQISDSRGRFVPLVTSIPTTVCSGEG